MANLSTSEAKQLSRAAGEALVVYRLARRGWRAVNANAGFSNMPNLDLIALKEERRITIQVKGATADDNVPLAGSYRPDGRYFNAKEGPPADFVVAVQLHRPAKAELMGLGEACFVLPVDEANRIAREFGEARVRKLKRDGSARSPNFPIWIHASELTQYREAWQLLDGEGARPHAGMTALAIS